MSSSAATMAAAAFSRPWPTTRGSMLDHWLQPLTMMYHKHRTFIDTIPSDADRLDRLCEINIEMQVRRIAATPIVENAWARGQSLHVHGWIYAIHDGLLRDLGPHLSSIAERDALPSIDQRVVHPVEPVSAMRRQAMDVFANLESSRGIAAAVLRDRWTAMLAFRSRGRLR